VLDVTVFLVDMDRDFQGFNEVYAAHFTSIQAARTTVSIRALPTPIAVEFKVIARAPA
jgi:enamine deaminase RidA (YjgF/YER057c/UK114 family)